MAWAASAHSWQDMLTPLAVLSMVFGNVIAIAQTNLKRLLAYSAIGNVGFILLGFVAGTAEGYEAALYYTVAYVIMTLGSFGVLVLASRAGFEAEELDQFKGLSKRDPLLAYTMMALMFSTAGVPPFIGFWAKFNILQALWLTHHMWLILIAVSVSVDRRVLLPARRQAHVLRCAGRSADRAIERDGGAGRARAERTRRAGARRDAGCADSTLCASNRLISDCKAGALA